MDNKEINLKNIRNFIFSSSSNSKLLFVNGKKGIGKRATLEQVIKENDFLYLNVSNFDFRKGYIDFLIQNVNRKTKNKLIIITLLTFLLNLLTYVHIPDNFFINLVPYHLQKFLLQYQNPVEKIIPSILALIIIFYVLFNTIVLYYLYSKTFGFGDNISNVNGYVKKQIEKRYNIIVIDGLDVHIDEKNYYEITNMINFLETNIKDIKIIILGDADLIFKNNYSIADIIFQCKRYNFLTTTKEEVKNIRQMFGTFEYLNPKIKDILNDLPLKTIKNIKNDFEQIKENLCIWFKDNYKYDDYYKRDFQSFDEILKKEFGIDQETTSAYKNNFVDKIFNWNQILAMILIYYDVIDMDSFKKIMNDCLDIKKINFHENLDIAFEYKNINNVVAEIKSNDIRISKNKVFIMLLLCRNIQIKNDYNLTIWLKRWLGKKNICEGEEIEIERLKLCLMINDKNSNFAKSKSGKLIQRTNEDVGLPIGNRNEEIWREIYFTNGKLDVDCVENKIDNMFNVCFGSSKNECIEYQTKMIKEFVLFQLRYLLNNYGENVDEIDKKLKEICGDNFEDHNKIVNSFCEDLGDSDEN